jgi:hypothetical protein
MFGSLKHITIWGYDIRWGKPGKTQKMQKTNIKHHEINISGGENWGKPK